MADELHSTESSEATSNGSSANEASGNDAFLGAATDTAPATDPAAPTPDSAVSTSESTSTGTSPANSDDMPTKDWQTLATAELLERRSQLQEEISAGGVVFQIANSCA